MPPPKNTSIIVKPSHRRWINQRATQLQTCFCNHFTAGLQKHCTSFSCGNNKQLLHFHFVQPSLDKYSVFLHVYWEVLVAAVASEAKKSNVGPILQYYHLLHCQRLWNLVFIKTFWPKIYTNIMITICTNSIPRQHGPVDIPLGISSCPSLPELVHRSLQWGMCCLRLPWGFRLYNVS